jgi:hypothetical protein
MSFLRYLLSLGGRLPPRIGYFRNVIFFEAPFISVVETNQLEPLADRYLGENKQHNDIVIALREIISEFEILGPHAP